MLILKKGEMRELKRSEPLLTKDCPCRVGGHPARQVSVRAVMRLRIQLFKLNSGAEALSHVMINSMNIPPDVLRSALPKAPASIGTDPPFPVHASTCQKHAGRMPGCHVDSKFKNMLGF